jgi:hypothetical protein
MKSSWIKSFILLGALTLPSHAILGVGVHLAPAFGPEVKASNGDIMPDGSNASGRISLMTGSVSGLSGIGTKFWIDFLPFIDVEATTNIQVGYYDMAFIVDDGNGSPDTTEVDPEFNIPLAQSKPFYGRLSGDVAVLYPFFKIPLLKLYAGGGLSYIAATPVLNNSFAKDALTQAEAEGSFESDNANSAAIQEVLVDALKDEGLQMGLGFFVQAGAKVKPPIIPIALNANGKYGFGGPSVKGVSGVPGFTAELGAAFAF